MKRYLWFLLATAFIIVVAVPESNGQVSLWNAEVFPQTGTAGVDIFGVQVKYRNSVDPHPIANFYNEWLNDSTWTGPNDEHPRVAIEMESGPYMCIKKVWMCEVAPNRWEIFYAEFQYRYDTVNNHWYIHWIVHPKQYLILTTITQFIQVLLLTDPSRLM